MSALYIMRYVGGVGAGGGCLYIGKGIIVGVDATEARFEGTYSQSDGRFRAKVRMLVPAGTVLVTGLRVDSPRTLSLTADWPSNFADGNAQEIRLEGEPVHVSFEKLKDIP